MSDVAPLAAQGGWPGVLSRLLAGEDLDRGTAHDALEVILSGEATAAQIAGLIVALRMKGETIDELVGMVDAMLGASAPLELPPGTLDIVGMGGSEARRTKALNISTMASIVAAAAGARVCKHGNRKASSTSGSFDLLDELGVATEIDGEAVRRCVDETGVGFCFARGFHPAMRFAGPVRAELGIPTVFNVLGPLSHPGRVTRQVVGVADPRLVERIAGVLAARGVDAWVVRGDDGLDELTTASTSTVLVVHDGQIASMTVDATEFGLPRVTAADRPGGDPTENAKICRAVLGGESGAARDLVVLNAAAGLVVAGVASDLEAGIAVAERAIDTGAASTTLDRLVDVSNAS